MLAHEDSRESIGVHFSLTLVVGDPVKLAKRLAEWLADFRRKNAFAPSLNFRGIGGQRMPEPDRLRGAEIKRIPGRVENFMLKPNSRALPALLAPENPDESSSKESQQWMLN